MHRQIHIAGVAVLLFLGFSVRAGIAESAEDAAGMARTPPMGWYSWNVFRLNINDRLIRAQAAALMESGMRDAGYQYIVIDGGWEGYHDTNGVFHSDPQRFPDMKGLCDYIHSLGLKVGIHTSPGPKTCSGREASYGHERQDAETFASWGMDFVKYDWCSAASVYQPEQMQAAYIKMSQALKSAGRPMLYSLCQYGTQQVWKWGAAVGGQMWRTTSDIQDNYFQMLTIGFGQNGLEKYAGPGHWNDPDMLEIGNRKMNRDEHPTHRRLWGLLAAPRFAGNDLTQMSSATREILTNPGVIALDQDAAGVQGRRVWQEGPVQVWMKPLRDGSAGLGIFNIDKPLNVTLAFKEVGLPETISARDLWLHKDLGKFNHSLALEVPRHGVVLLKVTPISGAPR